VARVWRRVSALHGPATIRGLFSGNFTLQGTKIFPIFALMKNEYQPFVDRLIELAIAEDIGDGDHTSLASIPAAARGRMQLLVKDTGTIAGIEVAQMVFRRLDPEVRFEQLLADGARVKHGDIAFYVEGRIVSMLQAERVVLNIMQRMSGVATETARYAERLNGLKTKVLDTRKTTPGMRVLDKMAVALGGGENHRMGLFDMILLKDNHIDFAGGVRQAIEGVRKYLVDKGLRLPIEVEVRTLEDIGEVFAAGGADRIMLDNFSVELTREAVALIAGRIPIESSGGITLETIREYGQTGVDYVSVGALTHQIKSLDMSLKAVVAFA
jgi:nicotinate-nucleotide pyrophosphorylase (carboxylating)